MKQCKLQRNTGETKPRNVECKYVILGIYIDREIYIYIVKLVVIIFYVLGDRRSFVVVNVYPQFSVVIVLS